MMGFAWKRIMTIPYALLSSLLDVLLSYSNALCLYVHDPILDSPI